MPAVIPDPRETAWCAGFPQSGRRELTPAEVAELQAMAGRFLAQGRGGLAVVVALLVGALAAGIQYSATRNVSLAIGFALFLSVSVIPLALMLTRDWLTRANTLRRDAASGWLRQFTGQLAAGSADETRERLLRRRLLLPDAHRHQWFEVLPHSSLVWTANGHRIPSWVRAIPNVVAGVPEFAAMAAEWVSPVDQPGSEGLHLNFRDLTPAECDEVRRHSHKLLLRPLGSALLFTIWALFPWLTGSFKEVPSAMFVFGAIAAWAWWNVVRVLGIASKLRRDAENGRVVIVRRAVESVGQPTGSPILAPPDEFLPESGMPWTMNEQAAPWRRSTS